uniref:Uncharacterized protein n=1 Tax=Gadus morhua TaxID=8049 RepID=A0A8C5FB46_GADMO
MILNQICIPVTHQIQSSFYLLLSLNNYRTSFRYANVQLYSNARDWSSKPKSGIIKKVRRDVTTRWGFMILRRDVTTRWGLVILRRDVTTRWGRDVTTRWGRDVTTRWGLVILRRDVTTWRG